MKSNQTLKAARNKANAGFSLVELLLVTVIFSIIFLTISRVMMTTVKSDARLTEQSEASTRNSVITGVLQRDFKNPLQLFYGSPVSMNGTFPIPFAPHSDYQLSPGSALRVSSNNPQLLYSTAVLEIGEATARFTIPATSGAIIGWRTTLSEGGTKYSQMQVTRTSSVNRRTFT
ncbi:MAG TPA: prepilin-type N-terminal cleavage/methylation domain-containing protein, partial [Pyrinomonadaceae bacterium]|nr:prepilin-type N-terminal cleavage/methylation domain-containing protein [Pyrinomonadaceae bacterium]